MAITMLERKKSRKDSNLVKALSICNLLLLFTFCSLEPELPTPSLELDVKSAYSTNALTICAKFVAVEDTYRYRYILKKTNGTDVAEGETEPQQPGVWYEHSFDVETDDEYRLRVVVQVEKNGDFEDVSYLDKSVDFWVDRVSPSPSPTINPTEKMDNKPIDVTLDHPELSSPDCSPVKIYYTLNGDEPTVNSYEYNSSPITIYETPSPVALMAIAIDEAGNPSSISTGTYSFIKIQSAINISTNDDTCFVNTVAGIIITGFGFDPGASVVLNDIDGTLVEIFGTPSIIFTKIEFTVNLSNGTGGTPPGVDVVNPGIGTITVTNPNTAYDTIEFTINP